MRYTMYLMLILLAFETSNATEETVTGSQDITPVARKSGSAGSVFDRPTAEPWVGQGVDLYTGQHSESFVLCELLGRGGLSVDVGLDYNGNVGSIVKEENRLKQASPFGLGMSADCAFIRADHKSTTTFLDDEYSLYISGTLMKLYAKGNNEFAVESGAPWKISRTIQAVGDCQQVVGWTVVFEDASVYRFGDFSGNPGAWNATEQILRWGDYVGANVSKYDSVFAYRWNLKVVHDADSLNWIKFHYLRDLSNLRVMNTAGTGIDYSRNTYVRASYVDSIVSADGRKLAFSYAPREDVQFNGDWAYDFIYTKRIEEIRELSSDNAIASRLRFRFNYLNQEMGANFSKLLLTQVQRVSGDGNDAAPPLGFSYDVNTGSPRCGAVTQVDYPSGAIKSVVYSTLDTVSNCTKLERLLRDHGQYSSEGSTGVSVANNFCIINDGTSYDYFGVWAGYWKMDSLQVSNHVWDRPAALPGGFLVTYDAGLDKFIVIRNIHGAWDIDTVAQGFSHDPRVWVYPGTNCFMAVHGYMAGLKRVVTGYAFYRLRDNEWIQATYSPVSDYYLEGVRIAGDIYSLSLRFGASGENDGYVQWRFGKFDHAVDSVVKGSVSWSRNYGNCPDLGGNSFDIGNDIVVLACGNLRYTYRYDYANHEWEDIDSEVWDDAWQFRNCIALPGGYAYTYDQTDGQTCRLISKFFSDGSPQWQAMYVDQDEKIDRLLGNNRSIVMQYNKTPGIHLWHWGGYSWAVDHTIELGQANVLDKDLQLFERSYIWGAEDAPSPRLKVGKFQGSYPWTQSVLTVPSASGRWVASERFVAARVGFADSLYMYRPYFFGNTYHRTFTDSVYNCTYGWNGNSYVSGDNLYNHYEYAPTCRYYDLWAYQVVDSLSRGQVPIGVVSEVRWKQFVGDANPVVVRYQHFGGLTDETGTVPRFARVMVSTPFWASQGNPDGYSVHFFYNDIDTTGFWKNSVYDSIRPPDLSDSSTYGIRNGGYWLDGREYLTYSFTVGDGPSVMHDSSRSFYKLQQTFDSLPDVFRIVVDSVHARKDKLCYDTKFLYDPISGQTTSTITYLPSNVRLIDSVKLAFKGNAAMLEDNALTLVAKSLRLQDSSGVQVISMDSSSFTKKGSWKLQGHFTWRDPLDPESFVLDQSLLPGNSSFDQFGNVVNTVGPTGDTLAAKYDNNGRYQTATATDCTVGSFLLQDFEQGNGWDGWALNTFRPDVDLDTAREFTGNSCLYLHDLNLADAQNVWGPERAMLADSIKDSLYSLSYWVKANDAVFIHVWVYDNTGYLQHYWTLDYSPTFPATNVDWELAQSVFNLPRTFPGGRTLGRVELHVGMYNARTDTNYAYIDDIRFHPVRSEIVSGTLDAVTGLPISASGTNNIPLITQYDGLGRLTALRNWQGQPISTKEYHASLVEKVYSAIASGAGQVDSEMVWIDHPGQFEYSLFVEFVVGHSGQTAASILCNDTLVERLHCEGKGCPAIRQGAFMVRPGDIVKLLCVVADAEGAVEAEGEYQVYGYNAVAPSWTKTTTFIDSLHSTAAVQYFDGFGRSIQERIRDSVGSQEQAIVSGLTNYDAQGRSIREYKTHRDIVGSTGLMHFTPLAQAETDAIYAFDNPAGHGPVCQGYPFVEYSYAHDIYSRLDSVGAPGDTLRLGSTRPLKHQYASLVSGVDSLSQVVVTVDPDGLVDSVKTEQWGRWTKHVSPFVSTAGLPSSVTLTTRSDWRNRTERVTIDTLGDTSRFLLRTSHANGLGLVDTVWQVDGGEKQLLYDRAGRVRLVHDDGRTSNENRMTYYRYDNRGRKIEEGTIKRLVGTPPQVDWFTQENADNPDWPPITPDTFHTVSYRWYYDYYKSGTLELVAPGKPVRVTNADSSYYRNFYYYASGDSDKVVVKLPQGSSFKPKLIKHFYNRDGSLCRLKIYPNADDNLRYRSFDYCYDPMGRLESISRMLFEEDTLQYVKYEYFPDGTVKHMALGITNSQSTIPPQHDTVQMLSYTYNPIGQVRSINNMSTVAVQETGSSPHFAMSFGYHPSEEQVRYFDGRLRYAKSVTSAGSTKINHPWRYEYNDLGWLTYAQDTILYSSQRFFYNALGQRTNVRTYVGANRDSTDAPYEYYQTQAGSSRLKRVAGTADTLAYDAVGNLIKDRARGVYDLSYDYRNLLVNSHSTPNVQGGAQTNVVFLYDEVGSRIKKGYSYNYWSDCPPPPPEELMSVGSSISLITDTIIVPDESGQLSTVEVPLESAGGAETSSSGGGQCLYVASAAEFYLYDNGVLLATFDHRDSVVDIFINGPTGRIASYYQNRDNSLYYFVPDHLGSTRVVMKGTLPYGVAERYSYLPFGEISEAYGNYPTAFKFTGKQQDVHGGFNYTYFGSRYYDPRLGQFASLDVAGQYASGYLYGGNNPTMGIDRDGNFFQLAVMMGIAFGAYQGQQIAQQNGYGWFGSILAIAAGGAIGGASAHIGTEVAHSLSAVGGLAAGSATNSAGMHVLSGGQMPFQVNVGVGSFSSDGSGFSWADFSGGWMEDVGTVMGYFSVAEDLNRLYASAFNTLPKDQLKKSNLSEEQAKAGEKAADRDFYDSYDDKVDVKTGEIAENVPANHADVNIRTTGRGHYDFHTSTSDPFGGGRTIVHVDAFGGGIWTNPGMFIQHIVFEAGIFDAAKAVGIDISRTSAIGRLLFTPGAFYRIHPILNYNRNFGSK